MNEVNAQCGKVFVIGDNREKYSYDKKLKVIKMYLEGVGIRSIERLEHISTPLILKWIKGVSKIIKNKLINTEVPDKLENIEILEIDEIRNWTETSLLDFSSLSFSEVSAERSEDEIADIF